MMRDPSSFESEREARAARALKIAASRRALALLLRHHGDHPPDADTAAAVRRWRAALAGGGRLVAALPVRPDDPSAPVASGSAIMARFRVIAVRTHPPASVEAIMREVAARHCMTVHDLLSDRRAPALVRARQEAMYLAARATTLSLPVLGRLFHRDHTTVLHGIRRHAERAGLPWSSRGRLSLQDPTP